MAYGVFKLRYYPARSCGQLQKALLALRLIAVVSGVFSFSCGSGEEPAAGPPPELVVAAASNLTAAFQEIGKAFSQETGIKIIYNFGATTQLAQQIKNGAPFDVFAAADAVHVDQLVQTGKALADSRTVYARGRLALWVPENSKLAIRDMIDLRQSSVRVVAIANPEIAPYGAAAVEVLKKQNLWETVQPKIVRAENVNAAKQLAATGNADAVFTAYSLLLNEPGLVLPMDASLHSPIDQALCIVASSSHQASARRFANFVLGEGGRAILARFGYEFPAVP
ncbi:MAG: molybdate ABC transporter substrate-binding protein [Acidobacteria bacterium]|nr:molybdate ABC transporter substrate-binding protein [Acidobacteriota bacterium]